MKTYTTLQAIGDMIVIYLIVIVVSMLVAAVIHGIVVVLSRQAEKDAAKAPAKPTTPVARPAAVAVGGVPQEHLAAIAAAVAAMMGAHRIVRIETPDRGHGWTAEARTTHHTSHLPRASH
jgi:hypothetical protein